MKKFILETALYALSGSLGIHTSFQKKKGFQKRFLEEVLLSVLSNGFVTLFSWFLNSFSVKAVVGGCCFMVEQCFSLQMYLGL